MISYSPNSFCGFLWLEFWGKYLSTLAEEGLGLDFGTLGETIGVQKVIGGL